ncbi:hypothetical protein ACJX0J_042306 [Zea mays]
MLHIGTTHFWVELPYGNQAPYNVTVYSVILNFSLMENIFTNFQLPFFTVGFQVTLLAHCGQKATDKASQVLQWSRYVAIKPSGIGGISDSFSSHQEWNSVSNLQWEISEFSMCIFWSFLMDNSVFPLA